MSSSMVHSSLGSDSCCRGNSNEIMLLLSGGKLKMSVIFLVLTHLPEETWCSC